MNERDIAGGFSALWSEFFPMLSPTFIIAFNEAFVQRILGRAGIVPPVEPRTATHRPDVLAEFGFRLAASANRLGISTRAATSDKLLLDEANILAVNRIRELRPHLPAVDLYLNDSEREEGARLAAVYEDFLALLPPTEKVVFSPKLLGSGVLGSCYADLAIGDTLFEVKTVNRPFHSRDLRQLLVYFALEAMGESKRWDSGGLLNPRTGTFCKFSIDWLVTRLSGGRPPKLVLSDFMQALYRDVVLDRRF